jgi:hypothetical protein
LSKLTNPISRAKKGFAMQLIDFILAPPLGALIVTVLKDTVYAAMIIADCDECGFNDLGKLLFGGLIVAIIVGIGGSLLWRRWKERHSRTSDYVSIRSTDQK